MKSMWEIVSQWEGWGQFLFLMIFLSLVGGVITQIVYYLAVMVKGWPSEEKERYEDND